MMNRKKVATITLDVMADGSCLEVELRAPMPSGRPRVQLVNVRRADRGAARQVLAELELSLVDAVEDGLRAALPHTRRG